MPGRAESAWAVDGHARGTKPCGEGVEPARVDAQGEVWVGRGGGLASAFLQEQVQLGRAAEAHGEVKGAVLGVGLVRPLGAVANEGLAVEPAKHRRAEQAHVELLGRAEIVSGQGEVVEAFEAGRGGGRDHALFMAVDRCGRK